MKTKLLVFAAAIALSFTFMGCKGGNTPEDPSNGDTETADYSYTKKGGMYEVILKSGQRLYFCELVESIQLGDDKLCVINHGTYYKNNKDVDKPEYGYSGDVVIPSSLRLEGKEWIVYMFWEQAFADCSELNSITLPNSVEKVDGYAFFRSTKLKRVSFGNHMVSLAGSAFQGCTSLAEIICYTPLPNKVESQYYTVDKESYAYKYSFLMGASEQDFSDVPLFKLYVPKNGVEAYKQDYWQYVTSDILPIEE